VLIICNNWNQKWNEPDFISFIAQAYAQGREIDGEGKQKSRWTINKKNKSQEAAAMAI